MRGKLGVLLMEEEDGQIAVQLFADPDKAGESFDNLRGSLIVQRATFISLDYEKLSVAAKAKDLPVPEVPVKDRPDAWKLGEGPIKFDKGGSGESGNG